LLASGRQQGEKWLIPANMDSLPYR
jgi:hypothetical protein